MQEPRHRNQADVVLEPLSPVGHSHPLHPITRQHKPPASLGGCVFEDCSDLCRLCRVCVCLSLFLSLSCQEPQCPLDWQHFQVNFSAVSKKKKVIGFFSGLILCVCVFFPLTFIWTFYLSLENLMNSQRSICTLLIMECFWFVLQHALYLKEFVVASF